MSELTYNRKERAFILACAYLGTLFVSTIILWWSVLVGGNPLTFNSSNIVDDRGHIIRVLHNGQAVGVRREVCSTQTSGVEFFPTLRDKSGMLYPLPSGMLYLSKGCSVKTYGFIVPDLPPGDYTYQSTLLYQANLVGRDEMITSPELPLKIAP